MAAMLVSRDGAFDRALLDCHRCTASMQEYRGCGVPPVVHYADGTVQAWHVEDWDGESDPAHAYPYANLGGVYTATGSPWPWCPRWFDPLAGFTDPLAEIEAERMLELAAAVDNGTAGIIQDAPLTKREHDLLLIGLAMREAVRAAKRERAKDGG